MVFSGSEDSAICMMDFSRRIPVLRAVCEGHEQGITSIVGVPSAGEQYFEVMSSSWDGTVRKWRIPRSTSLAAGSSMVGEGMQVARWSHTASVLALDYEGEHLFTACEDGHCYRRHRYALGTQGHKEFITRYGQRGIQCNAVKAAHLSDGRLQLWVG